MGGVDGTIKARLPALFMTALPRALHFDEPCDLRVEYHGLCVRWLNVGCCVVSIEDFPLGANIWHILLTFILFVCMPVLYRSCMDGCTLNSITE